MNHKQVGGFNRRTLLPLHGRSAEMVQCCLSCLCLQVSFPTKAWPPAGLEQEG